MTVLLFDLDDTLLVNPMEQFLPAYLQGLGQRMSGLVEPSKMVRTLMAATSYMVQCASPERTLRENFDSRFFPELGLAREEAQATIDQFYVSHFPRLQALTQPRPQAVAVVKEAIRRGYQVGIATNPLFPLTAIEQRLAWAGLPVDEVPFALVPSYESFHFSKPNPAYYAEFLAQMGWPEGAVVMVGDDIESDILPAQKVGLPVYWVTPEGATWDGAGDPPPQGSLDELLPWLEVALSDCLLPEMTSRDAILAVMSSTPAALASIMKSCRIDELARRPAPDEWSPTEVLCHLRDVEIEVNLVRVRKVMDGSNPFIPGQDTDRWAAQRQYIRQDGWQALQDFTRARLEMLDLMTGLSPEAWELTARHAIFGPTRLSEILNIVAKHDRLHVRQIHQAIW